MDISSFGLKQIPFDSNLDPHDFFYGVGSRTNEQALCKAIRARCPVTWLLGEPGIGKSALLRKLSDNMSQTHRFLFPRREGTRIEAIVDCLLEEFELDSVIGDLQHKLETLREKLEDVDTVARNLVLIVDDAHELSASAMADLAELVAGEHDKPPVFLVLFAGPSDLSSRGHDSALRKIDESKACWCHLGGLTAEEVRWFINQRLELAGYRGEPLFSDRAIKCVIDYSEGNIGKVNVLCGFSLLNASRENLKVVTEEMVEEEANHFILNSDNGAIDATILACLEDATQPLASEVIQQLNFEEHGESQRARGRSISGLGGLIGRGARWIRVAVPRIGCGRFFGTIQPASISLSAIFLMGLAGIVGFSGAYRSAPDFAETAMAAPSPVEIDHEEPISSASPVYDLRIQTMLLKAEAQIAAQRLFGPEGDNALETYREITDLVERKVEILNDLVQTKKLYQRWGHEAEVQGDWINAAKFYNKAMNLAPHDKELSAAIERVRNQQVGADSTSVETKNQNLSERDNLSESMRVLSGSAIRKG